ncbi:protein nrt1/ ptr family 5.5 [Phtheirospermum japonicum]|uniref:Protein nrt1/ ptr family 5.5 n=1 Tax=Phtheirospermum japonicum TaxID=374723 RepID=A0A830DA63_9LAMI|nr:protein nrt1/ ptr family 5.5 [Phtheirospermum japonicum]
MKSFVRISALLWADILVAYALFVMQNYLTDVWKLSLTHAAGILNIWGGISMILPVFFLFLVDSLLGNFTMLVLSSIAYTLGIGFVAMSTPPVLTTCKQYEAHCIGRTQKALFYTGMGLIAVGIAGHLVSVNPFLEEQKDKHSDNKDGRKDILKLSGFTLVVLIPIIGAIALPYIKPWSVRFGIQAICTVVATFFFLTGWVTYDKDDPQGSPLTNVCRVFVAVVLKISQPFDAKRLYKKDDESFSRTRFLRCLEKAAVKLPDIEQEDQVNHRWRLCSVSEVEDAKIAVRMVPMWLTFLVCGIVSSTGNTYFVEQANHMNRNIGKWKVPLPILLLLFTWVKCLFSSLASHFLQISKKYAPPVGIGIAMVFSVLCCITAARIEKRRLGVIMRHDLVDKPKEEIPMSVFWLLFQFFLLAGLDSFFEKSVVAFYNEQSPESMRKYLGYFTRGVSGLGFMCSVLSVYVVGRVSEKGGKMNWFQFTMSRSRLDRYYWVLAGLSSVNLVVFMLVASCYRYKNREASDEEVADEGGFGLPSDGNGEGGQCCPCLC